MISESKDIHRSSGNTRNRVHIRDIFVNIMSIVREAVSSGKERKIE